jgi:hypothetical protein
MPPDVSTQRLLIAMAGGRCSFPNCDAPLIAGSGADPTFIGEIAHIRSPRPRGPRYDAALRPDDADAAPNLLVLCPNHHAQIDRAESNWTDDQLVTIKREHEAQVACVGPWEPWPASFSALHYVNSVRVAALAALYGHPLALARTEESAQTRDFTDIMRDMLSVREALRAIAPLAIEITRASNVAELVPGSLCRFNCGVRTKNFADVDDGRVQLQLEDPAAAPQIYIDARDARVVGVIDPKWATTNTALSTLREGSVRLAGLLQVKALLTDGDRPRLLCSTLVLGHVAPPGLEDV